METRILQVLVWFLTCHLSLDSQSETVEVPSQPNPLHHDEHWFPHDKASHVNLNRPCYTVHPTAGDIGKRFYAILPYFDRERTNTGFLHKFRGTVNQMAQGLDMLDREAAFYAAAITPIIFLHRYRDTWCLLERFHRALRLYQISHPTEKRASLKLLQNLRPVSQKVRSFLNSLPSGSTSSVRTSTASEADESEFPDKDIRFLKELIKNLG